MAGNTEQHSRRVAVVTGAARGIGHATAARLLRRGWIVGAFDIESHGLSELKDIAAAHGTTVVTGTLDVRDAQQWREALASVCEDHLDLLVNNAGLLAAGPFVDTDLERHRALVDVNVLGTINGAHTAFPYLKNADRPVLLNLGSASAIYGQPDLATYGATKFAVRGLTEALELEWAEHGIAVLDLWPLFVNTGMVKGVNIGAIQSFGVRLNETDVAAAAVAAVERSIRSRRSPNWPRNVHHAVGSQARFLAALSQVTPNWANRLLTERLTRRPSAS
ncbi:SDR family oxidoreductase [Arthrobacter sp. zg-Y877]|uniref:SDR family oxidoreductase n=1 Tax=Arthrobacter sp. zg-Y877 TaxID=3049074 RepID=UPI0025A4034F|nr:SDR family oxidoreductase [Arthrobacter sp. zg-Y877]MDM7991536.1 SDR family oxidoreductase [Arthrobacter sp. zg-Y877]